MKRRTLLESIAFGTTVGFAGCLDQGDVGAVKKHGTDTVNDATPDNGDNSASDANTANNGTGKHNGNGGITNDNGTETGSDDETTGSNSTPRSSKGKPALVNHSFEVVSAGCGTNNEEINVSFNDRTVRLTGGIRGKNSCYTAELANVTVEQGTLTLTIRSFEPESSGACAMCLTTIEYESTYTFEGELPKRVVVVHNCKRVLTKTR